MEYSKGSWTGQAAPQLDPGLLNSEANSTGKGSGNGTESRYACGWRKETHIYWSVDRLPQQTKKC